MIDLTLTWDSIKHIAFFCAKESSRAKYDSYNSYTLVNHEIWAVYACEKVDGNL